MFVNAVLWCTTTGAPWRDLPARFGKWKTVYNRFRNWARRDIWRDIFRAAAVSDDEIGGIVDGSVVRAHQDSAGGRGGQRANAIGRSRGGVSSKIHAAVDTKARPLEVKITPGQQHDSTVAEDLIDFIPGRACIADLAYDADRILAALRARGIKPVIPAGKHRKTRRRHNKELYKLRYLVEVFFHNIKRFRRVATRYDKTAQCYVSFVHIACVMQWVL